MNGYKWFYKGTSGTVFATDSYSAHKQAVIKAKATKASQHMVSVLLYQKEGQAVIHSTSSI